MYYGSETVAHTSNQLHITRARRASGQPANVVAYASSERRADVMVIILKVRNDIWNPIRKSIRIYLKNNPAKFHLNPNWNNGALRFFEERHPNTNNKEEEQ